MAEINNLRVITTEPASQFNVGDIVTLNSGSPDMTVAHVGRDENGNDFVTLCWFDDGVQRQTCLPPKVLRKD